MSDDRLKFASYKYKRDNIEVTAKISLHKRELGLRDYLLAPRSPFYIKIENGIRYDEKPLIIEGKDIKDMNKRFERITFFYYVKSYLCTHDTILELPFLNFIDVGNHVKFGPVNFSPDNNTYTFFMYCDCALWHVPLSVPGGGWGRRCHPCGCSSDNRCHGSHGGDVLIPDSLW